MTCLTSRANCLPSDYVSAMPVRREYCSADEIVPPEVIAVSCGDAPEVNGHERDTIPKYLTLIPEAPD